MRLTKTLQEWQDVLSGAFRQGWGTLVYFGSFFFFLILVPAVKSGESEPIFRQRLRRAIRYAFAAYGVRVSVRGASDLHNGGGAVVVANHSSWFDQLALLEALDCPLTFMANRKYFSFLGLASVLRRLGCVPINPGERGDSLQAGCQLLELGKWLVVYPEGTRSSNLLPFRRGAALLALKAGVPLQPVRISGAEAVLRRQRSLLRVRPGTIKLEIQPVVSTVGATAQEITQELESLFASASSRPVEVRVGAS